MLENRYLDRLSDDVRHMQLSAQEGTDEPAYDLDAVRDLAERLHADGVHNNMPLVAVCGKALATLSEDQGSKAAMMHRIIDTYLAMSRALLIHNMAGKSISASSELLVALNKLSQSVLTPPARA